MHCREGHPSLGASMAGGPVVTLGLGYRRSQGAAEAGREADRISGNPGSLTSISRRIASGLDGNSR